MLSKWPIRVKLLVGLALLVAMLAILASSGLYTTYAYRHLVKSLSRRVTELPLAAELNSHVGELRITLSQRASTLVDARRDLMPFRVRMIHEQFAAQLQEVAASLAVYQQQLDDEAEADLGMADLHSERETAGKIEALLGRIRQATSDPEWMGNNDQVGRMDDQLEELQRLVAELPSHLHAKLRGFAVEVRGQYRTLIVGIWVTSISAALVFALFIRLFYRWIFLPLRVLIQGSRQVAAGRFDYRIRLDTRDEMSELAEAMNDMTARFRAIRDDLDRQVQERTKEVVRSERLASVGFLAAGVAHEINNPLASIAMCAESLEGRIRELLEVSPPLPPGEGRGEGEAGTTEAEQQRIIRHYLAMIQSEAFRCKAITEKLLDFSRMGQAKRQATDLRELVEGMIGMVGTLGRYHQKHIELLPGEAVVAPVNAQEIKQVVLNLLTNALDSLDENGTVRIELAARAGMAELTVSDNGCGMGPAVLEHVFEPFFTSRRSGQGTGLGLSITHRIVADHGGTITAESAGPGQGSTFRVSLPLVERQPNTERPRRAA